MAYPSQALQDWCRNIQKFIDVAADNGLSGTAYRDGFCECTAQNFKLILSVSQDETAQLISGLFWSVWIDQVMFYILIDGGISTMKPDKSLYAEFRSLYTFPKLHSHPGRGEGSPVWFLLRNRGCKLPDSTLLLEDKKEFWGEVADWLDYRGKSDVKLAALTAFKEDLKIRFPEGYDYLFPED